jgi:hypothetical protein
MSYKYYQRVIHNEFQVYFETEINTLKKLSEEKSFSFIGNIRGRVLIS